MKKLISATIAFALSVSALVPVFAADTFKDVNATSYAWAYSYVEDMAELGLIKGYEDGTFRPQNSVSRMDAFALFSRLMGSNSEVNADTLEKAKEKYASSLSKYELSYAEGDIAYMLSRGVLAENELDTYFAGKKKTEAMPRYEAAILITKAMLGEQDAKNEVLVDMDYTDVSTIPKAAKQYVYYVTQKSIMSGMGDGAFSANTDVLRGQIAVMLSKVADAMNYKFESVTIDDIDISSKNITIKYATGSDIIGYDDDARFIKNGELIAASQIKSGQQAILTYVSDGNGAKLAFADVSAKSIEETKSVIFKSYTSNNGTLLISVTDPKDNSSQSYTLSSAASITSDGADITVNSLRAGDYITIGLKDDKVVAVSLLQKSAKIDATIEKIDVANGTITISSDDTDFDGLTLAIAQDVTVYRNGDTSGISELGRGDKAVITLEYGKISKVNATAATKTVTGVLKAYTVSSSPSITVNRDGTDYTFDIPTDVAITLNNEKATLADLKLGNTLTLTVESEVVRKISVSSASGSLSDIKITGTVVGANDKTIIILNSDNGGDVQITISCTNQTKIITLVPYAEYSIKKIKSGDTIEAHGGYENGFFVASTIIVTPTE